MRGLRRLRRGLVGLALVLLTSCLLRPVRGPHRRSPVTPQARATAFARIGSEPLTANAAPSPTAASVPTAAPTPTPAPVKFKLRLHALSTEVVGGYGGLQQALFNRVKGQRTAYVSTQGPGAVYLYNFDDLGANPRTGPAPTRYRRLYGDLPRGTVRLDGVLNDRDRSTATPLIVTAEHDGERKATVRLQRLAPTADGRAEPVPIDPRPRNPKYQGGHLGDFDGDGQQDAIATFAGPVTEQGKTRLAMTLYLYAGGPGGRLQFKHQLLLDDHYTGDPFVLDFDGDGRDELMMVNDCSVRGAYTMFCQGGYGAWNDDGTRLKVIGQVGDRLQVRQELRFDASFAAFPLVVADFDGDRRVDVLSGVRGHKDGNHPYLDEALVYFGQPNGALREVRLPMTRHDWNHATDLDGDGAHELFAAGWRGWHLWRYRDGAFQRETLELEGMPPGSRADLAGWLTDRFDFDGDGDEDLLVKGHEQGGRGTRGDPPVKATMWLAENLTPQAGRSTSARPENR